MSVTGRESGTTLIEALAVVSLTALVVLIGYPALRQAITGFAQREAVSVVATRLRQVRADAMRSGRPKLFEVGRDGRGFGASGWPYAYVPAGVRLEAADAVTFFGDGSSHGGAISVSAGIRATRLTVAPASGAVSEAAE